jgi:DNA-binding NarL/FixJ family response regulator
MFTIEQNGQDWVVQRGTATVSVHPNREEAERAVEWLDRRSVVGPRQAVLFGALTPRESVVLERLSHRGSYPEIARELFVSTNTIKTHVKNVYAKLGVTDRGSAVAAATVLGLIGDADEARATGESGDNREGRTSVTAESDTSWHLRTSSERMT